MLKGTFSKVFALLLISLLISSLFSPFLAYAIDVSNCTVINTPGTYTLTNDIMNSTVTNCIQITSSNVTLEGGGHLIDGTDTSGTYGIYVYSPSGKLSNVVVRNIRLTDWYDGIYFNTVDSSTVDGNTTENNRNSGIHLKNSDLNTISNNITGSNNLFGILLDGGSNENVISGNSVTNQGQGIQVGDDLLEWNRLTDHRNIISNKNISFNEDYIILVIAWGFCSYNLLTFGNKRFKKNQQGSHL